MSSGIESGRWLPVMDDAIARLVPRPPEQERDRSCVILGSFKYHDTINATIDAFTQESINVLAPKRSRIVSDEVGFPILESDLAVRERLEREFGRLNEHQFAGITENIFIQTISEAGFVYVVNPDGYLGVTVAGEIGWATGSGKPIFAMEPINSDLDRREGDESPYIPWLAHVVPAVSVQEVSQMAKSGDFVVEGQSWYPKSRPHS